MAQKTTVLYKGEKKKINTKYVKGLKGEEKREQVKTIMEGTKRPKTSAPVKRSSLVVRFENKYNHKITDDNFISKNIISKTGIDKILSKGRGAYYSAGSRPNVSSEQWARARLAGVILNSPARKVDKNIWEKYKK
tara:strand:- start:64 stop:468 length:405 start_codon:yes stop_codon:yes gene_type:complete